MAGETVARAVIEVDVDVANAAKQINKLRGELNALERAKFAPGTKAATAAAKEVDRLNKSIHTLGGTVDKSGNFINRHAVAINQLAFSAARAGSGFANFLPLLARVTTLAAKHEFGEKGLGGALSSLKEKFSGAGSAAEGLAGAGGKASGAMGALKGALAGVSLGAIAAAAAIALVIVAIGFLVAKLGPLGSALTKAQDSIKLIFEGAGEDMLKFAREASHAFGITEQAALRFVGKIGQLNKSFGLGSEGAGQLTKALLISADVLRSTSTEFIAADEALQAVFDTAAGNVEGLRRFDVFLSELGLTGFAVAEGLKVTTGAFDNVQRSLVTQLATIRTAQDRWEQYINTMDSTQRQSERVKAAFDDIKAGIGQGLAPILSTVLFIFLGLVDTLKKGVNAIGDWLKRNKELVDSFKNIAAALIQAVPGLELLIKALGFLHKRGKEAAEGALTHKDALAELQAGAEEIIETFNNYKRALTVTDLEQLVDAHENLRKAIEDGARSIANAELALVRAQEDAAQKAEDAQRKVVDAYRERNEQIGDANRKLHDVEIQNTRALVDVEDNLSDARLDRRRALRDAEEKLADERKDFAKRVADAQEKVEKARIDRLEAILRAQLALQNAQFRFNTVAFNQAQLELTRARQSDALKEASSKLDEVIGEGKEKLARLERDLAEERVDQNEKVAEAEEALRRVIEDNAKRAADAKRELARVIEDTARRIQEAQRDLARTEIENNRRLFDSRRALEDATRESVENIRDANTALQRLNWQLGTTDMTLGQILDKLEKMKTGMINIAKLAEIWPDFDPTTFRPAPPPPQLAHGFTNFPGGLAMVGERGRELVNLPRGSDVISNDRTEKILEAMGKSGNTITINQVANDPEATAFMVAARLMRNVNN